MNNDRRKRLNEIKKRITAILCTIEEIRDEEEAAYENLPESLQESERGKKMYEAMEGLQDLYDHLESAADEIESIIEIELTEFFEILPAGGFDFRIADFRQLSDVAPSQRQSNIPVADCCLFLFIGLRRICFALQPDISQP